MRNAHIGLVVLALGAVACEPAPEPFASDVFWVEFTTVSEPCAGRELVENFTNADAAPDQVVMTSTMTTDPGRYIGITLSENGEALVNVDGDVLIGTVANDGSISATFLNEEGTNETRTATGYTHTRVEQRTLEQTIELTPTPNEDNPRYTGSFVRAESFLFDISETDEWDEVAVGTGISQIPETRQLLVWTDGSNGEPINQEFEDDCQGKDCTVTLTEDCTQEFDLEAVRVENTDLGDFDVLGAYDQPTGI